MPRKAPSQPSYRLHKPSGKAVVTIDGKDHYLGDYGSAESRARYDELIARWLANGRKLPEVETAPISVNEVLIRFSCGASHFYEDLDSQLADLRAVFG